MDSERRKEGPSSRIRVRVRLGAGAISSVSTLWIVVGVPWAGISKSCGWRHELANQSHNTRLGSPKKPGCVQELAYCGAGHHESSPTTSSPKHVFFVTVLVGPISLRATCVSEAPTLWMWGVHGPGHPQTCLCSHHPKQFCCFLFSYPPQAGTHHPRTVSC